MGEAKNIYFTCLNHFLLNQYCFTTAPSLNEVFSWTFCRSEIPDTGKMSDKYSGTNRDGNNYTSYGGNRGNYYYNNADGGRYYNAGEGQGSFYRNADKGYQWYQNSSGERSYQSYGKGSGGQ